MNHRFDTLDRNKIPISGRLEVITGCMFSGKTTALIKRLEAAKNAGSSVMASLPILAAREIGPRLFSHDFAELPAIAIESISQLADRRKGVELIGIDEIHFLGDSPNRIERWCAETIKLGTSIILAGLDFDFRGSPFPWTTRLLEVADQVQTLSAICARCGKDAIRSQRLREGTPADWNEPTLVTGGPELYEARCIDCFRARRGLGHL
jgi:thymidine kinase